MRVVLRILSVIAFLILVTQTVRHAYLLWLEPKGSVLDSYDQPLKGQISEASSLSDLLNRYEKARQAADVARKQRRESGEKLNPPRPYDELEEPYKSELMLRDAIKDWEAKSKDVYSLRFYWLVGLLLAALGIITSKKGNRWLGLCLLVTGFSEIIYWTSPTFLGAATHEFDRLLMHKLVLSVLSLGLLGAGIAVLRVFSDAEDREALRPYSSSE